MDDYVKRQLIQIQNLLKDFKNHELSLSGLVNKLSGLLDALKNHETPWTNQAIQNEVNELEVALSLLAARKESKLFFFLKKPFWWEKRGIDQSIVSIEKSLNELL